MRASVFPLHAIIFQMRLQCIIVIHLLVAILATMQFTIYMLVRDMQCESGKQIVLTATCLLWTSEFLNMHHKMPFRFIGRFKNLRAYGALIIAVFIATIIKELVVEAGFVIVERIGINGC